MTLPFHDIPLKAVLPSSKLKFHLFVSWACWAVLSKVSCLFKTLSLEPCLNAFFCQLIFWVPFSVIYNHGPHHFPLHKSAPSSTLPVPLVLLVGCLLMIFDESGLFGFCPVKCWVHLRGNEKYYCCSMRGLTICLWDVSPLVNFL